MLQPKPNGSKLPILSRPVIALRLIGMLILQLQQKLWLPLQQVVLPAMLIILLFAKYEATATGENPWYQFLNDRTHLSVSKTIYDLMNARNDPRIPAYFLQVDGAYVPAPNGTATESSGWSLFNSRLLQQMAELHPPR